MRGTHWEPDPFADDRELADVLREVNELRRSRALVEYVPATTNFRVRRSEPCYRRLMARCRRHRSGTTAR